MKMTPTRKNLNQQTTMTLEEQEQQDIANLREVADFAKTKDLKCRFNGATIVVIGTPDRRGEFAKKTAADPDPGAVVTETATD